MVRKMGMKMEMGRKMEMEMGRKMEISERNGIGR